ncbi:MAG: hypothetical protein NDI84_09460 [Steroidobacteraceae bacterium]|nr:hypothetical protein [Steroidobacteraceae bacterium]
MSRWRPSPAEERWLTVASRLGAAVSRTALPERSGGWRSTGPLARIALFVLGIVATVLLAAIFGLGDETPLLIAGVTATLAGEWLTVQKRLHASGIEEGLCVAGFLLIGLWITIVTRPATGVSYGPAHELVLIAAVGAAGLRRLNPFVTTCAVIALVHWAGSTAIGQSLDQSAGRGMTAFVLGCAFAAIALALGAREFHRPSHDRMLDWLVATLPVAVYAQRSLRGFDALTNPAGVIGTGRLATVALLVALGTAMLVTSLRRRRHAPLLGFLGCVACLAVEVRAFIPVSAETWLIVCGLVALIVGVTLDRYLRQPRNGVTSAALTDREGPLDLLQTAGAALLAQRAAPATAPTDSAYTPGGGRFGGGGASGNY